MSARWSLLLVGRRALVALVLVSACSATHDGGFGEGCSRNGDCDDGLRCVEVSTTAYAVCAPGRTARFCSPPCDVHDDCNKLGLVAPNGSVNACVTSCDGVGTCSWVGPK